MEDEIKICPNCKHCTDRNIWECKFGAKSSECLSRAFFVE